MPTPHDPVCVPADSYSGALVADRLEVMLDGYPAGTQVPGWESFDHYCVGGYPNETWAKTTNFYAQLSEAVANDGFYTYRLVQVVYSLTGVGIYPPGVTVVSDEEIDAALQFTTAVDYCKVFRVDMSQSGDFYCSGGPLPFAVPHFYIEWLLCLDNGTATGCMTVDDQCCTCFGGEWDPITHWCYDDPCDECYCALSDTCVDCIEPRCKDILNCYFDKDLCSWFCDPIPNCGANYHWDMVQCLCVPCPPEECYCESTGRCIPCDPPPCADVLDCDWDKNTCQWLCDPPNCAPGYNWYEPECQCVPDCESGECWCDDPYDAYDGECVSCIPPDCAEELNCYWSTTTCDWVCDDPDERCGPQNSWDYDICGCGGSLACHLRDTNGQYVLIHVAGDGTLVAERYDADDEQEEIVTIDDDTSCGDACCWLIDGVIVVLYRRGRSPKLAISRTHARIWDLSDVPGEYARLCSIEHRNRLIIMGYRSGVWYQRVGKIPLEGDVEWSEENESGLDEPPPTGNGHFRDPVDNVLSFAWESNDGVWHVSICRAIDLQANGVWE